MPTGRRATAQTHRFGAFVAPDPQVIAYTNHGGEGSGEVGVVLRKREFHGSGKDDRSRD